MNDPVTYGVSFLFSMKQDNTTIFRSILQQGFQVRVKVGCDIQSLLCEQFDMLPEYVSNRISTVFLNGSPVDDVSNAVIHDGDTLALSAAMPGLVGATFRRSGCLAVFRGSITYRPDDDAQATSYDGFVTLKLFNLLMDEVGPTFLERGIWITGAVFSDFWQLHATAIEKITMDGLDLKPEKIDTINRLSPDDRILIRVSCSC